MRMINNFLAIIKYYRHKSPTNHHNCLRKDEDAFMPNKNNAIMVLPSLFTACHFELLGPALNEHFGVKDFDY